ncbi:MAG: DUF3333 domain-containing protein, partial [Sphingomonadales bacterium]|nr:DUF3333 domain-containing protein [Sphingomonadales bacterium]
MTDGAYPAEPSGLPDATPPAGKLAARDPATTAARLKKRYAAERNFRLLGLGAVLFSVAVLAFLLITMSANGIGGFKRTELRTQIDFAGSALTIDASRLASADAMQALEGAGLPDVVMLAATRSAGAEAAAQLDRDAWREVARKLIAHPDLLGQTVNFSLPVSDDMAAALRGDGNPKLQALADKLAGENLLVRTWDWGFLARADSTHAQAVGIWGALKGSIFTMGVTLALAFPIGVLAAIYLEEYAPRNRWTDVIEVSINNLAAVPSIIFGLLGLAVFLGFFPYWRSAPLIGGMTLALMTMPVIVISGRNAIKSVPPSISDAALAVGASRIQVVFHHILPLALPGILTGTIIGMARALGETAPLLM